MVSLQGRALWFITLYGTELQSIKHIVRLRMAWQLKCIMGCITHISMVYDHNYFWTIFRITRYVYSYVFMLYTFSNTDIFLLYCVEFDLNKYRKTNAILNPSTSFNNRILNNICNLLCKHHFECHHPIFALNIIKIYTLLSIWFLDFLINNLISCYFWIEVFP